MSVCVCPCVCLYVWQSQVKERSAKPIIIIGKMCICFIYVCVCVCVFIKSMKKKGSWDVKKFEKKKYWCKTKISTFRSESSGRKKVILSRCCERRPEGEWTEKKMLWKNVLMIIFLCFSKLERTNNVGERERHICRARRFQWSYRRGNAREAVQKGLGVWAMEGWCEGEDENVNLRFWS